MQIDRVGQMEAFVRTVQAGGFSRAARELGLSPSAISMSVSRLEDRLGVRLLNRTTRKLFLTSEGERFFDLSKDVLAKLDKAESEIANLKTSPRGLLRMHTFSAFGLHQLTPVLPLFLTRYPEVQVDLSVSDRVVNLIEEEVDIAVGLSFLSGSMLHARKICELERIVCAAPSYLERYGTPTHPGDLARHNCICVSKSPELSCWNFYNEKQNHAVNVSGNICANTATIALQLALAGVGVIRLVDLLVVEHIQRGGLVPLFTDLYHVETQTMTVAYAHGKHKSPKVVAMVNFLCEQFSGAPWRRLAA
jgi:DNA-binding transcriptional LysR family regulator